MAKTNIPQAIHRNRPGTHPMRTQTSDKTRPMRKTTSSHPHPNLNRATTRTVIGQQPSMDLHVRNRKPDSARLGIRTTTLVVETDPDHLRDDIVISLFIPNNLNPNPSLILLNHPNSPNVNNLVYMKNPRWSKPRPPNPDPIPKMKSKNTHIKDGHSYALECFLHEQRPMVGLHPVPTRYLP